MAFEPKNKEIKQALSDNKNEVSSASSFKLPMFKEETDERVKTFTFRAPLKTYEKRYNRLKIS